MYITLARAHSVNNVQMRLTNNIKKEMSSPREDTVGGCATNDINHGRNVTYFVGIGNVGAMCGWSRGWVLFRRTFGMTELMLSSVWLADWLTFSTRPSPDRAMRREGVC